MKPRLLNYKDNIIIVPFITLKSKDEYIHYINLDDGTYLTKLPVKLVVDFIRKQKDFIFENGFIDKEDYIITNINTDSLGWPIDMEIVLINQLPRHQKENLLVGFEYDYKEDNNGEEILDNIVGIRLGCSKQLDDYEVIYKRDDMAHMECRNKKIYNDHIDGKTDKEISKKYCLKESTIRKIITKMDKLFNERLDFQQKLINYFYTNNIKRQCQVYTYLCDYISENNIFTEEDICNLILSDTKIYGIGKVYRNILREFVNSTYQKRD